MNRRDSLLAVLVAGLWGFNFVVIDWGMGRVPPLLFVAIRFVAVPLPAVFFIRRPKVPWPVILRIGATMSLGQFGLLYCALHAGLPAGLAGLVLQAQVPLTILLAAVALKERPSQPQAVGVGLGITGLALVAFGRGGHVPLGALLLCLAAAASWSAGNVIARQARVAGGLGLTVWSALVVPVPLIALSLLIYGPHGFTAAADAFGWRAALSTLYTAACSSLIGYGIYNSLLARNPPSAVVPWILLVPPVAIACAWALLGEVPGPAELIGGGILIAGVLVATLRRRPFRTVAVEPAVG